MTSRQRPCGWCDVCALLRGRRTHEIHAGAFEPMPPGDRFGELMNSPKQHVVSCTLEKPSRRHPETIRDDVAASVRALRNPLGGNIVTDGSSQLVHALLKHDLVDELHLLLEPTSRGNGKRRLPTGVHTTFTLRSATPYPSGVVELHNARRR